MNISFCRQGESVAQMKIWELKNKSGISLELVWNKSGISPEKLCNVNEPINYINNSIIPGVYEGASLWRRRENGHA